MKAIQNIVHNVEKDCDKQMKKIFFILMLLFFSISVFAQSSCQIAHPKYGVVKCDSANTEVYDYPEKTLSSQGEWGTASFTCISQCDIFDKPSIMDSKGVGYGISGNQFCPSGWFLGIQVLVNGKQKWQRYWDYSGAHESGSQYPIEFSQGQELLVKAQCCPSFGACQATPGSVEVRIRQIFLYDQDLQHTQPIQVDGSKGCIPNSWVQSHTDTSILEGNLPQSYYTSTGTQEQLKSDYKKNEEIASNLNNTPENLKVGQTYSYLAGWQSIPDIGIIYGKEGTPSGYCGGTIGNRKLYSYEKITTASGQCYFIPTQVQKSVECCYNEDCQWPSTKKVCDPNTFTCTDKKPCNTDLECSPEGQTLCKNKTETIWTCDISQPWQPFKGTCTFTENKVVCCSDAECGPNQYCNRNEGCKNIITIQDCPYGKCCKAGGDYKEQKCTASLECCTEVGATVGDCKSSCTPTKILTGENGKALQPEEPEKSGFDTGANIISLFIPIIIVILIGVGIAMYYIYYIKPKQGIIKTVQQTVPKCSKCQSSIKQGAKFCQSCGSKV